MVIVLSLTIPGKSFVNILVSSGQIPGNDATRTDYPHQFWQGPRGYQSLESIKDDKCISRQRRYVSLKVQGQLNGPLYPPPPYTIITYLFSLKFFFIITFLIFLLIIDCNSHSLDLKHTTICIL